MARYLRVGEQFFDNSGAPLSGGKLKFFESGAPLTDPNLKNTYSDSGETVPNTNPIVLDSAGRSPVDIWFTGAAQIQLLDSGDVQLDLKDPVPALPSAGDAFSTWNGVITYDRGEIVIASDSNYYRSIITSNLNQNPTSTSGKWERIVFVGQYEAAQTYTEDEMVVDPADNNLYMSLVDDNIGNAPNSSASEWKVMTSAGNVTGPGSSTDNAVPRYNGTGGTTIQSSGVIVDDSDNVTGIATLTATTLVPTNITGWAIGTDIQAYSAVLAATTASFTTADETKLDGIEASATADQTGAEIKALYEAEADTNAFTDDDHTKLDSIEASADVTDEANVKSALDGATLTAVTVASTDKVLVKDVSDSDNLKTVTAQDIADLANVASPGMVFIESQTASGGTQIEFTDIDSTYDQYVIKVINAVPSSESTTRLTIQFSADNGSSYDSTGAHQFVAHEYLTSGTSLVTTKGTSAAGVLMNSTSVGSAVGDTGASLDIRLNNMAGSGYTTGSYDGTAIFQSSTLATISGSFRAATAQANDAIRLYWLGGANMESGTFVLFGVRKT